MLLLYMSVNLINISIYLQSIDFYYLANPGSLIGQICTAPDLKFLNILIVIFSLNSGAIIQRSIIILCMFHKITNVALVNSILDTKNKGFSYSIIGFSDLLKNEKIYNHY